MTPEQVAGHVMTGFRSDVFMTGPFSRGDGTSAVRVWLENGYGVSIGNGYYRRDEYPEVVPIKGDADADEFEYLDGEERGATPERVDEILSGLKGRK